MTLRSRDVRFITVFGLGYRRPAEGTWGSLPPVIIAGVLIASGLGPAHAPVLYHAVLLGILLFFSGACVLQGDQAEMLFLRKDPGNVVADETAGQCLPLLLLPAAALGTPLHAGLTLLGAFLAFRIFDILKLPPARGLQRIPGGWGILIDDLVAGVQAMVVVQVVIRML